jgi:TolB-like protein/Flp pilus assembly protein TadD
MSFFSELKRRNVFRVGIAYVVVSWLVLQVADVILNNVEAPGWVFHVVLLLLAIGFIVVLAFAWAFEMTPEGLKRESEVDRGASITHQTGRKLDRLITGVLVLALGYFVFDKFVLSTGRDAALVEAALERAETRGAEGPDAVAESGNPIAVLPFINMSSDPEQEYFSDGLSEELLNLLAKIPELKVASRSSSFQFKGEKFDLTEVAQKLKVAHVLEGSVRKAGSQVRITAQLIKADDGFHMWSETYDRSLDNIFAIQDEISAAVVKALKLELLGEAPKAEVVNPEAYALWLKGRYIYAKWGKDNFEAAIEALQEALEIEPNFAQAWASLAVSYLTQTTSGYRERDEGVALAREAIDNALAIDPDLPEVLARLGLIQGQFEWKWAAAEASVLRAVELAPESDITRGAAGSVISALGRVEDSLSYYQQILEDDPLDLVTLYNTADQLHRLGRMDDAERTFRRLLELNPEDWGTHTQLAIIMLRQGRVEEAWAELALEVDPQQQEWGRLLALHSLGRTEEAEQRLQQFIAEHRSWARYLIASVYAWRGERDMAFDWLGRAVEAREAVMSDIKANPLLTGLHDDPRWAVLMDGMGLPR